MTIIHQFQFDTPNLAFFDPSEIEWPDWLQSYLSTQKYTDHSIYIRNDAWHLCTKQHGERAIPIGYYITLTNEGQLDISADEQLAMDQASEPISNPVSDLITPTPKAARDLGISSPEVMSTKPPRKPRKRKPTKKD